MMFKVADNSTCKIRMGNAHDNNNKKPNTQQLARKNANCPWTFLYKHLGMSQDL